MIKIKIPGRLKSLKVLLPALVFVILLCSILFQFAYPSNNALPKARLFDQNIGGQKTTEIELKINDRFEQSKLVFELSDSDKSLDFPLRNFGASIHSELMANELTNYPSWQKLIPFSIFFKEPSTTELKVYFANSERDQAIDEFLKTLSSKPKNAKLFIKNNQVQISPSTTGYKINRQQVIDALNNTSFDDQTTMINVEKEVIEPEIKESDLNESYEKAKNYSNHKINIIGQNNATYSISSEQIIDMLAIEKNDQGETVININETKLSNHIKQAGDEFYKAPVPDVVTIIDGEESSREVGKPGESIDTQSLQAEIKEALESSQTEISIQTKPISIAQGQGYIRHYNKTQKGLSAYVARLVETDDVRVVIKQLDGNKWQASARDTESIVSASTYKLYVALMVLNKVNNNELKLTDKVLDTDINGCLEEMIVQSGNRCAENWINQFGAENINKYLYELGFSSATTFTNPTANHTSAKDLDKVLHGINNGTLLSGHGQQVLLDKLSRQVWRNGIPSGTAGWTQNKVGYLWGYTHDAGIVHHPNGSYILVVMTKYGSFSRIAQITREIEAIMY